ncbi:RES family NAD+ phosphorylase [Paludibaculum fermentans]|uniref:RES family NAD+ phosphorylase n=1 Tax=Paludibaculum fermentans TaxID=1473598 RepID=UPI003EC04B87
MFHPPPADLHSREPLIYSAPAGALWCRSHMAGHAPCFFGRGQAQRWDAPDGGYGVLYLGADEHCAFMESIGRGVLRTRLVPAAQLRTRVLSKLRFSKTLRLVDLVSSGGLTRLGAEGSLANGLGYRNSQRWSEALRAHPAAVDGIYYRSRHDPARMACALYEKCLPFVELAQACGPWAEQGRMLGLILDHYQFGTDL